MKIYSSPVAPSPRKVIIFIAEKGIENIQVKNLDLGKLEHKTSEYKKIAPNSRVPALELDSGEIILETTAICRYLECIYPEPNMFGSSPMEIAQIEMWYSRVSFELMMPLMHGFRHTHPHMSQLENQNNEFGIALFRPHSILSPPLNRNAGTLRLPQWLTKYYAGHTRLVE